MASLKFYLEKPTSKHKTQIFFKLNYGAYELLNGKKKYLPLKYYINKSIEPSQWDTKKGKVKQNCKQAQYLDYNVDLNNIENDVFDILSDLSKQEVRITNDTLKKELDKVFKIDNNQVDTNPKNMELSEYIDHFIETSNNRQSTIKSYKVVKRDLSDYETAKKVKLRFESIDIDFYNDFVKFLKSKQYAPNTIGTRIKILKTFLSSAKDANLPVRDDFQKKAFAKITEETDAIYLSETELMKIYSLDLEKKPKLDRARDLFLIGAYTGLRFSDLSRLNEDNITEDTISVKTIKTGAPVVIPIHSIVRAILNKYSFHLPRVPSNQKFNDYIKEVAKLSEINEFIKIEQTKGDLTTKKSEPKYNKVTSHTARRSFATNAFLADIPTISIMEITGHKTEKAFMKYIKISKEDNARKLMQHKFFTKMIVNK